MSWNVSILNQVVERELDDLPADMRAHFARISELMEEWGPAQVRAPHVKHLEGSVGRCA